MSIQRRFVNEEINGFDQLFRMSALTMADDGSVKLQAGLKAVDRIDSMKTIVSVSLGMIKSKGEIFSTVVKKVARFEVVNGKGAERYKKTLVNTNPKKTLLRCTPFANQIMHFLRIIGDQDLLNWLNSLALGPEVVLPIKIAFESGVFEMARDFRFDERYSAEEMAEALNNYVEEVRGESRSTWFKRALNANKRRINKNRQGVREFLNGLFKSYSKVLFARFDCTYRRPEGMSEHEFARHITPERAKADLAKLLKKNALNGIGRKRIGYIVKMEMGPHKGIHFHILVAYKGREHREGISIAKMYGDYWKEITEGDGLFFNCNQKWEGSPNCAIGMIHRDDKEKRSLLMKTVVSYMTKADEYFQFLPKLEGRTLFRSIIKKPAKERDDNIVVDSEEVSSVETDY